MNHQLATTRGQNARGHAGCDVKCLDTTPFRFSRKTLLQERSHPKATDLHPSRRVVGARDAEHISKVYEGFRRQRAPTPASL